MSNIPLYHCSHQIAISKCDGECEFDVNKHGSCVAMTETNIFKIRGDSKVQVFSVK